jgi:hypothetical protein
VDTMHGGRRAAVPSGESDGIRLPCGCRDGSRAKLPWSDLFCAVERGNIVFVRASLSHARCPVLRECRDAAVCTLAVVTTPRAPQLALALLTALSVAGIPFHHDVLRVAMQYAALETIHWLIQHGAAIASSADDLFLLCIHAGRLDVLDLLYQQTGHISQDNLLFTRTAS